MGLTPDSKAERCEDGPEDELKADQSRVNMKEKATNSIVDIGDSFYCFRPGEPSTEDLPNGLFLPSSINMAITLNGHLNLRTRDQSRHLPRSACHFDDPVRRCMPYIGEIPYFHLGSQETYPLLKPLTSFTIISKDSKSIAVQASNATSNRMSAHSKKA